VVANPARRHRKNVSGAWFVDDTCIDCDASRQCAPWMFAEVDGQSVVIRQPRTESEQRDAARAMLACPTGSIGIVGSKPISENLFPALIDGDVYYCGFNSPKSFGANAFFVRRDSGNLLIDSPRFVNRLVARLQSLGGVQHVLLTHRDDVADTERWARHFGARVWIHEHDRSAAPFATDVIRGSEPTSMDSGLLVIPVPGHTRGSVVYLLDQRFLFTGDSLYWSRDLGTLSAFRQQCWYSWAEQTSSLERLANYRFEWVLAGHGDRRRAEPEEMHARLNELVGRMHGGLEEDVGEW
jgi:glyoxylase-like metal-dependent hydrolase (beta-lactamase superfamily II)